MIGIQGVARRERRVRVRLAARPHPARGGIVALLLSLGACEVAPAPTSAAPAAVFRVLEGGWEGSGTLLGRPGAFTMEWRAASDGFVRLTFTNAFVGEDGARTPVLRAEAVYLVHDSTARGVWIDSRPQRITLDASVSDSSVVTTWTADAERGRTEYLVVGPDEVVVRDFVEADEGLRPFGEARYRRR